MRLGLSLVLRASNLAGNNLQAAVKARALCIVVKSKEWRPSSGDVVKGCGVEVRETDAKSKGDRENESESEDCQVAMCSCSGPNLCSRDGTIYCANDWHAR